MRRLIAVENFAAPVTHHVRKSLIRQCTVNRGQGAALIPGSAGNPSKRERTWHVGLWYAHRRLDGSG